MLGDKVPLAACTIHVQLGNLGAKIVDLSLELVFCRAGALSC